MALKDYIFGGFESIFRNEGNFTNAENNYSPVNIDTLPTVRLEMLELAVEDIKFSVVETKKSQPGRIRTIVDIVDKTDVVAGNYVQDIDQIKRDAKNADTVSAMSGPTLFQEQGGDFNQFLIDAAGGESPEDHLPIASASPKEDTVDVEAVTANTTNKSSDTRMSEVDKARQAVDAQFALAR